MFLCRKDAFYEVCHKYYYLRYLFFNDVKYYLYTDLAIGAPYEESNKGAIYIYHGGYDKLTYTQKIKAQDISSNLQSFGWYISTAYDIDNNDYQGNVEKCFYH